MEPPCLCPSRLRPPWRGQVSEAPRGSREGVTYADVRLPPRKSGLEALLLSAAFVFPAVGIGDILARGDQSVLAHCRNQSVLTAPPPLQSAKCVLWSGTMTEFESADVGADPKFEPSPLNWAAGGWTTLDASVQRWVDAGRGSSLLIRTHAAHIVSDAPSATRFVRTWADHGVRLVYDLVSMLTPQMVASAALADVYARRIDALIQPELSRGIEFVLVSNLRVEGSRVLPTAIDDGLLDSSLVRSVLAICADRGIAAAVLDLDLATVLGPCASHHSTPAVPPYTPPRVK